LKSTDKELVINTINHYTTKAEVTSKKTITEHNVAYFVCNNCGYHEKIKPQTLIFSRINNDKIQDIVVEDYSYMIHDSTLPRTKEYTCTNTNCDTHKKPALKEAVFFRASKSFQLIYICTVCQTIWY